MNNKQSNNVWELGPLLVAGLDLSICLSVYLSIYPSISVQDPPNRGGRRHQGASPFYMWIYAVHSQGPETLHNGTPKMYVTFFTRRGG